MNWQDLKELDLNSPELWPLAVKVMALALLSLLLLLSGGQLVLQPALQRLEQAVSDEHRLALGLQARQQEVTGIPALQQELVWLQQQLEQGTTGPLVQSALLDDIAAITDSGGLQPAHITWQNTKQEEWLSVLPMEVVLKGGYWQLGHFMAGIGNMPPLVAASSVKLKVSESHMLHMSMQASIYTFAEQEDP